MTSKTLRQLPLAEPLDGSESIFGTQGNNPVKLTVGQLHQLGQDKANAAANSAAAALVSQNNSADSEANALSHKNAAKLSEDNSLAHKNAASTSESNTLSYKNSVATSAANTAASKASALNDKNAASTSESETTANAGRASATLNLNQPVLTTLIGQAYQSLSNANSISGRTNDLSGLDLTYLHRSPNAIVDMKVYDTRTDSDGGAWVEKCANTSWFNEPLNGLWIGAHASELDARDYFGSLEQASIVTGDSSTFTNGTGSWVAGTANATMASVNGKLRLTTNGGTSPTLYIPVTTVIGQRYRVEFNRTTVLSTKNAFINIGTTAGGTQNGNLTLSGGVTGIAEVGFMATATTTYIAWYGSSAFVTGDFIEIDDFTVKPVDLSKNPSGVFFQDTSDGKFKRLWKNRVAYSAQFDDGAWNKMQSTIGANADGASDKLIETTSNTSHYVQYSNAVIAGIPAVGYARAKAGERGWMAINVGSAHAAYFDLVNGVVGTVSNGCSAQIKPAADQPGYYDCEVFVPTPTNTQLQIFVMQAGGVPGYAGDGSSGLYLARAHAQPAYALGITYEEKTTVDGGVGETLRGNKARFPRVAAIVAEAARVIVYDLIEPGRPMWRVFAPSVVGPANFSDWWRWGREVSAITAGQGRIVIALGSGSSTTSRGLPIIDFPGDKLVKYAAIGDFSGAVDGVVNGQTRWLPAPGTLPAIPNTSCYSASMAVMPDAPLDPVTGLQIPTIAVSTGAGVAIIHNNGTIANSASTGLVTQVSITPYAISFVLSGGTNWNYALKPGTLSNGWSNTSIGAGGPPGFNFSGAAIQGSLFQDRSRAAIRFGSRLSLLKWNESAGASSLVAHISDSYNTGWLPNANRAWMSDVTSGALSGVSLVEGGFDDPSKWTTQGGASVSGGKLSFDGVTSSAPGTVLATPTTAIPIKAGTAYEIAYTVSGDVTNAISVGFPASNVPGNLRVSPGTNVEVLVATQDDTVAVIARGTTGIRTASIDNVSVRAISQDRSYKGKHATIYGTLSKTPVAAAAQLAFYSGFSGSNYLQEAYSSDLDPGTGQLWVSFFGTFPNIPAANIFPAVSSELTVNGDFSAGSANWNIVGTDATHIMTFADGKVRYQSDTTSPAMTLQQSCLTAGKWYVITTVCSSYVSGSLKIDGTDPNGGQTIVIADSVGTKSVLFKANTISLSIYRNSTNVDITLDSVSVKEIGPAIAIDRSAATGAYYRMGCLPDGKLVAEVFDGTTTRTATASLGYNSGIPFKASMHYDGAGKLSVNVNGVEVGSATGAALASLSNANAVLTVGNSRTLNASWPGSMALVKVGLTIPTSEQSQFMYAQERQMFRSGARIALPESSSILDINSDSKNGNLVITSANKSLIMSGLTFSDVMDVPMGVFSKNSLDSNIRMFATTGTNSGVLVILPPINLKEALNKKPLRTKPVAFNFSGGTTDFALPVGFEAKEVILDGVTKREGSTKDWIRMFDGFKETIRFNVAPGASSWIQILARKV